MSEQDNLHPPPLDTKCRPVGGTEHSWCKAVPGGTGVTVLALLLSKPPDIPLLQESLRKLQSSYSILNSKIHFDPSTNTYSYLIPSSPSLQVQVFDQSSTVLILQDLIKNPDNLSISLFQLILEQELNRNSWCHSPDPSSLNDYIDTYVFFASVYTLDNGKWVVVLRLHTSVCDRATAATILRELLAPMTGKEEVQSERGQDTPAISSPIEDYIPNGKANKPFWARGADILGYSLNALRFTNLEFKDAESPRSSHVIRLQLNSEDTDRILVACKSRGIKLCGLFAAACFIATRSSKSLPDEQSEKYAVVTLVDCRSTLEPVLTDYNLGFYYSAILNTHDVNGREDLWELAKRTYTSFANAKSNHKHFTDMSDLNFLMCKAIDNPGLTPSSSLRTSIISVFEDSAINSSNQLGHDEIGLEDYIGCASVHGVGTSIAIFDTIRDGKLDCACVYPSPLHSREQIQGLVDGMIRIMIDGSN